MQLREAPIVARSSDRGFLVRFRPGQRNRPTLRNRGTGARSAWNRYSTEFSIVFYNEALNWQHTSLYAIYQVVSMTSPT